MNIVPVADCCEDCQFHVKEIDNVIPPGIDTPVKWVYKDTRKCTLFDKDFHIDELFDEDCHHKLRPSWCDALQVEIKNGWLNSLLG